MITYRYIKSEEIEEFSDELFICVFIFLDIITIFLQPIYFIVFRIIDKMNGEENE